MDLQEVYTQLFITSYILLLMNMETSTVELPVSESTKAFKKLIKSTLNVKVLRLIHGEYRSNRLWFELTTVKIKKCENFYSFILCYKQFIGCIVLNIAEV